MRSIYSFDRRSLVEGPLPAEGDDELPTLTVASEPDDEEPSVA